MRIFRLLIAAAAHLTNEEIMRRFQVLIMLLFVSVLVQCGDNTDTLPPGTITVGWRIGSAGCEASGITTVKVQVTGATLTTAATTSYQCSTGEAEIQNLVPGTYNLTLYGQDAQGNNRFGGTSTGVQVRSEGNTDVGTVQMTALPASLTVTWFFHNSRMCAANDVHAVTVTLFDAQDYEQGAADAACEDGEAELTPIEAGTYVVDVVAKNDTNDILFTGQSNITLDRGDQAMVEVELGTVE
jgi:hypothetical protein